MLRLLLTTIVLMLSAHALAQGNSTASPGKQKGSGQSAKQLAPGQEKPLGKPANTYAPGIQDKGQSQSKDHRSTESKVKGNSGKGK